MRNYDTTNFKPYPRITKIEITYSETGVPNVEYVEQMAIIDGNGNISLLASPATRHVLPAEILAMSAPAIKSLTGETLEGSFYTCQELVRGFHSYLRVDQNLRDSVSDQTT